MIEIQCEKHGKVQAKPGVMYCPACIEENTKNRPLVPVIFEPAASQSMELTHVRISNLGSGFSPINITGMFFVISDSRPLVIRLASRVAILVFSFPEKFSLGLPSLFRRKNQLMSIENAGEFCRDAESVGNVVALDMNMTREGKLRFKLISTSEEKAQEFIREFRR